jgi:hypothetical protein
MQRNAYCNTDNFLPGLYAVGVYGQFSEEMEERLRDDGVVLIARDGKPKVVY